MSVARDASFKGEDEIEYCRTRIGGKSDRNASKGSDTEGKRSRRSRTETRLWLISAVYLAPERACSSVLIVASWVASARVRMSCIHVNRRIMGKEKKEKKKASLPVL